MKVNEQIWYSYLGKRPNENQIGFYDSSQFQWIKRLEENFSVIKEEILEYVEEDEGRLIPYFNIELISKSTVWKTSAFTFWKWNFKKNQASCVKTIEILEQIPNLVSAFVSILEPDSEIKRHRGDTNGIMRGHLPILIPDDVSSLGLKVNEDIKIWKEGELLLFNDAAYHNAWNLSNSRRIVLIIDIVRPEYATKKYQICSTVLSSLIYQNVVLKLELLRRCPQRVKNLAIKVLALPINVFLRIQNL